MDDGHVWYIVTREQAKHLFYNMNKEVYRVHRDGSESLCTTDEDFRRAFAEYATEIDYLATLYPFDEGDIYYTIEDGVIVESVWDSVSEDLYHPDKNYYSTLKQAQSRPNWNGKISLLTYDK